jgi:predicted phosphoribosyltransferase
MKCRRRIRRAFERTNFGLRHPDAALDFCFIACDAKKVQSGIGMPQAKIRSLVVKEYFIMLFHDRSDAGQQLAGKLSDYAHRADVIVLALPRGGVPIGWEVARALHVPLDVFLVRKLGVPGHEELAMGAIASGGVRVLNEDAVRALRIPDDVIDMVAKEELAELARREQLYRGDQPAPDVHGQTVILVDDGLATGSSMRAAVAALRRLNPARIVVAVPVGAAETCSGLREDADEVVCAFAPEPFYAVGMWYDEFEQTTDEEVRSLLTQAAEHLTPLEYSVK